MRRLPIFFMVGVVLRIEQSDHCKQVRFCCWLLLSSGWVWGVFVLFFSSARNILERKNRNEGLFRLTVFVILIQGNCIPCFGLRARQTNMASRGCGGGGGGGRSSHVQKAESNRMGYQISRNHPKELLPPTNPASCPAFYQFPIMPSFCKSIRRDGLGQSHEHPISSQNSNS